MSAPKSVVYIVEDDPSFRKSMERLIRVSGYEAAAFESANAFLTKTSIKHPACLLLDVCLPDVDGLSFQKELREKGFTLPVIFMTGHGNIPMGVQAMKNGAINHLKRRISSTPSIRRLNRTVRICRRSFRRKRSTI